jgi:uncharacterized protein
LFTINLYNEQMFIIFGKKIAMSPRAKKDRLIQMAPHFSGFKPIGTQCEHPGEIVLHFEEYESIKLCDYERLTNQEAAKLMNVSRPTFTRVYESARRKIAKAFVEGSCITIDGGKAIVDIKWYKCTQCKITFTLPENADKHCPFCKTQLIENI